MNTDPTVYLDPETAEVLAVGEAERREVAEQLVTQFVDIYIAAKAMPDLRRKLEVLIPRGVSINHRGHAVTCELGGRPARQVNTQELEIHAESLPIEMRPRDEIVTKRVFPKVSDLTRKDARAALALAGLTAEQFLLDGGEPRETIKVYEPGV